MALEETIDKILIEGESIILKFVSRKLKHVWEIKKIIENKLIKHMTIRRYHLTYNSMFVSYEESYILSEILCNHKLEVTFVKKKILVVSPTFFLPLTR